MATLKRELEITKIIKPTRAMFFKNLKVGDKIKLSCDVANAHGYVQSILVEKVDSIEQISKGFGELENILECFEYTET